MGLFICNSFFFRGERESAGDNLPTNYAREIRRCIIVILSRQHLAQVSPYHVYMYLVSHHNKGLHVPEFKVSRFRLFPKTHGCMCRESNSY